MRRDFVRCPRLCVPYYSLYGPVVRKKRKNLLVSYAGLNLMFTTSFSAGKGVGSLYREFSQNDALQTNWVSKWYHFPCVWCPIDFFNSIVDDVDLDRITYSYRALCSPSIRQPNRAHGSGVCLPPFRGPSTQPRARSQIEFEITSFFYVNVVDFFFYHPFHGIQLSVNLPTILLLYFSFEVAVAEIKLDWQLP